MGIRGYLRGTQNNCGARELVNVTTAKRTTIGFWAMAKKESVIFSSINAVYRDTIGKELEKLGFKCFMTAPGSHGGEVDYYVRPRDRQKVTYFPDKEKDVKRSRTSKAEQRPAAAAAAR